MCSPYFLTRTEQLLFICFQAFSHRKCDKKKSSGAHKTISKAEIMQLSLSKIASFKSRKGHNRGIENGTGI